MFRKSTALLFQSLPKSTPIVVTARRFSIFDYDPEPTHQSWPIKSNAHWLIKEGDVPTVHSQLTNEMNVFAENEKYRFKESVKQIVDCAKLLQWDIERSDKKIYDYEKRLKALPLFTNEQAKTLIENTEGTLLKVLDTIEKALSDNKKNVEFDYCDDTVLSFLALVLDEYKIELFHDYYYVNTSHGGSHSKHRCSLVMPEKCIIPDEPRQFKDKHPIYGPWLENFRDKLNAVIAKHHNIENEQSPRPKF